MKLKDYKYNPRPSKIVFYRLLCKALNNVRTFNSIMDCASAGAKNRKMFPGKEYYGVDINERLIEEAQKKYKDDHLANFYQDDMRDFKSSIKHMKFDLVVSTHTIAHIDKENKEKALSNLVNKVKTNGELILQCMYHDLGYCKFIENEFVNVKKYQYRGVISRLFEEISVPIIFKKHIGKINFIESSFLYKFIRYILLRMAFVLSWMDGIGMYDSCLIHFDQKK